MRNEKKTTTVETFSNILHDYPSISTGSLLYIRYYNYPPFLCLGHTDGTQQFASGHQPSLRRSAGIFFRRYWSHLAVSTAIEFIGNERFKSKNGNDSDCLLFVGAKTDTYRCLNLMSAGTALYANSTKKLNVHANDIRRTSGWPSPNI